MTDPITIRLATTRDASHLVDLWFNTWHATSPDLAHPEPRDRWEQRFVSEILPHETVLVAELESEIVGFMSLQETEGYLHLLYVSPQMHGRGIGSQLLAEAMRRCPSGLRLSTLESNAHARRFYEHHGWAEAEQTVHPRTGFPGVIYRWPANTPQDSN